METEWKTKPTDRFILKWIKVNLSSRITANLIKWNLLRPWMITVFSMITGVLAGTLFFLSLGFWAGLMACISQVFDGVDGQLARLTGRVTNAGGFLDSVLDRYADGSLVIGLIIFNLRNNSDWGTNHIIIVGTLALIGSGLISYTSARAEKLEISFGRPTLASKGSRTAIIAISGLLSPISCLIPLLAMFYVAVHTNAVVIFRVCRAVTQGNHEFHSG